MTDRNACRLLALFVLLPLALNWRAFAMTGQMIGHGGSVGFGLILLVTLALGVAAVLGLWRCREWGFVAFYGYVVVATVLLGISMIPYVPKLFSGGVRVWSVVAVNALVLGVGGVLHWRHRRRRGLH